MESDKFFGWKSMAIVLLLGMIPFVGALFEGLYFCRWVFRPYTRREVSQQ